MFLSFKCWLQWVNDHHKSKNGRFWSKTTIYFSHINSFGPKMRLYCDHFESKMVILEQKNRKWPFQVLFIARMMSMLHHVIIDLIKMPLGGSRVPECVSGSDIGNQWVTFLYFIFSSPRDLFIFSMTHTDDSCLWLSILAKL